MTTFAFIIAGVVALFIARRVLLKPDALSRLAAQRFGPGTRKRLGGMITLYRDFGSVELTLKQRRHKGFTTSMHVRFKPSTSRTWLNGRFHVPSKRAPQEQGRALTRMVWSIRVGPYEDDDPSQDLLEALLGDAASRLKMDSQCVAGALSRGTLELRFTLPESTPSSDKQEAAMDQVVSLLPLFEHMEREMPPSDVSALKAILDAEPSYKTRQRIYVLLLPDQESGQFDTMQSYILQRLKREPPSMLFHVKSAASALLLNPKMSYQADPDRAIELAQSWKNEFNQDPFFDLMMTEYVFEQITLDHLDKHDLPYSALLNHHWHSAPQEVLERAPRFYKHFSPEELCRWFEIAGEHMNTAQRRDLLDRALSSTLNRAQQVLLLERILHLALKEDSTADTTSWWRDLLPKLTPALTPKSTRMLQQLMSTQQHLGGDLSLSDAPQSPGDLSVVQASEGQLSEAKKAQDA